MSLNPSKTRGKVIVVSAPSGTGKTTLVESVLANLSGHVVRSVTCTTRKPRQDEKNGKDYWFITEEEFRLKKENGDFLEYASLYNYHYGTDRKDIERIISEGKDVVLVIDVKGALYLMSKMEALFIFICPPSMEELERRIRLRQRDTEEQIQIRLSKAKEEMEGRFYYDYIMVNDDFQIAATVLKSIIIAADFKNREKKKVSEDETQTKRSTHK